MLDLILLVAYVAILVVAVVSARSLAWFTISLLSCLSFAGLAVQFSNKLGVAWSGPGLQGLLLVALAACLALSVLGRRARASAFRFIEVRHSLLVVGVPIIVMTLFMIAMRLLSPAKPGLLTGVGYLLNHPVAEDNAKWVNVASQVASGHEVTVNGFIGGPLLLILVGAATAIGAASQVLLGGVNQVAVAADSIILTQAILVLMAPLALAPLAEAKLRIARDGKKTPIPMVAIWLGMLILASTNVLLTRYGHMSLQFVLIILALWVSVFLIGSRLPMARLLTTLIVVMASAVWFPLNVVGLALLVAIPVFLVIQQRGTEASWMVRGLPWALWLITAVMSWSPIRSSLEFAIGMPAAAATDTSNASNSGVTSIVNDTLAIFATGGGTEKVGAILGGLAAVSLIAAVGVAVRRTDRWGKDSLAIAPFAILVGYAVLVTVMDLWKTGTGPNYGSLKLTFAVTVSLLAVTIPIALMALDRGRAGMTPQRVVGVLAVLYLLSVDTILPRAFAELRPEMWPSVSYGVAPYWTPAEVKPIGSQPISGSPIGCVYLPTGATAPTVLPDGQKMYACTRMLVGLGGNEGQVGGLVNWMSSEWQNNTPLWNEFYDSIKSANPEALQKNLIVLDPQNNVIGLSTVQSLLDRYRPTPTAAS